MKSFIGLSNMSFSIFKSKTFWTLALMFVMNGYAAVSGQIPAGVDVIVNLALSTAATYFHVNPSQAYNPPLA